MRCFTLFTCKRNKIYTNLKEKGLNFPNIIHKSTYVSKNSEIDESSILDSYIDDENPSILVSNDSFISVNTMME